MKQKKMLLLATFLLASIALMSYFVVTRYTSVSTPQLFNQNSDPVKTLGSFPFRESFDTDGNHIIEIDAEIVEILREEVTAGDEYLEMTSVVLTSEGVNKTYKVWFGPDKQHRYFHNERKLVETLEEGVKIGGSQPVNETAGELTVGDALTLQFSVAPEYSSIVDSWKDFFNNKEEVLEVNYNFLRRITLLP